MSYPFLAEWPACKDNNCSGCVCPYFYTCAHRDERDHVHIFDPHRNPFRLVVFSSTENPANVEFYCFEHMTLFWKDHQGQQLDIIEDKFEFHELKFTEEGKWKVVHVSYNKMLTTKEKLLDEIKK